MKYRVNGEATDDGIPYRDRLPIRQPTMGVVVNGSSIMKDHPFRACFRDKSSLWFYLLVRKECVVAVHACILHVLNSACCNLIETHHNINGRSLVSSFRVLVSRDGVNVH